MEETEWDERNPGARAYLDEHELMRIQLETDHGTFEAVFWHDPECAPDAYTAEVREKRAIVQGASVAECISELKTSIDLMVRWDEEERTKGGAEPLTS